MNISLDIRHPDEMDAFAAFLVTSAANQRLRPARSSETLNTDEASVTREAEAMAPETDTAAPAEQTKRTRRTKAEIEADRVKTTETVTGLDPKLVADAAAAGVHVQGPVETDEPEVENGTGQVEKPAEEVKLTENDVRNVIIDLLNEAQAKFPDDADVRTKTLKPLLEKLGAQKISLIPMTEYPRVPGLLADARAAMDQAVAEAA